MLLFASLALNIGAQPVTQRQTFAEPEGTWWGVLPGGARSPTRQASAHFTPGGQHSLALTSFSSLLNVTCSARPSWTPAAPSHQPLLSPTSGLGTWPNHHLALLSPQREHQLILVPGTESGRWQALSKLLGVRVMGEASVSPSGKGKLPLCGLQGLSHVHPPQGLSVLEPGGPGRLEMVGMGTGLSRVWQG